MFLCVVAWLYSAALLTEPYPQEMMKDDAKLRTGPHNYHDQVFENEINNLITLTKESYDLCVIVHFIC